MGLRRVAGRRSAPAAGQPTSGRDQVAPGGKAGSTRAAAQVRLVDLGNRIVRTATVDLEVGRDRLNDTINRATDVVTSAKGIYVGSSTSVPDGEPATGQVTIRVPVDAFEAVLRELKALGTYRGEQSSTEDVTNQYVDLSGQLAAWRAQERGVGDRRQQPRGDGRGRPGRGRRHGERRQERRSDHRR
jgi:hypothetical protein